MNSVDAAAPTGARVTVGGATKRDAADATR